jgi:hypothetical protein
MVTGSGSQCVAGAKVSLFTSTYNPVHDSTVPARTAITGCDGRYLFDDVEPGLYDIEVTAVAETAMAFVQNIDVSRNSSPAMTVDARLKPAGKISISVAGLGLKPGGYVYIPGSSCFAVADSQALAENSFTIARVAAGEYGQVRLVAAPGASDVNLLGAPLVVAPRSESRISQFSAWKYNKKITLTTSASGAGVAGNVTDFPVLVRLNSTVFDFAQAGSDGADVRFAKPDGTPLSFEIEQWNSAASSAQIWVKVDTVFGNNDSQSFQMYWGVSTAGSTDPPQGPVSSSSNSAAVFDTAAGFQAVWHLNQPDNALVKDATANHFNGNPSAPAPAGAAGEIGMGCKFDGISNFIQIPGSASGKLNFPKDGTYALSAWVYADTIDTLIYTVLAKGNQQYNFELKMFDWEFAEYKDKVGWEMTYYRAAAKNWTYLVGIRNGTMEYFFVNGTCVDSTVYINSSPSSRYTGFDVTIGKTNGLGGGNLPYFFKGMIDEIRISNVANSADWIKLCYMNQKAQDALVVFK